MTPGEAGPEMDPEISRLVLDLMPQARSEAWRVFSGAPHALDLDELTSLAYTGLVMAATRWPAYCVAPDTRVLTADLRWVPAGSLCEGQELVGFDEYGVLRDPGKSPIPSDSKFRYERPLKHRSGRYYRRSVVTHVSRRMAPCLEILLADGRSVVCSADHKWLLDKQFGNYRAQRLGTPEVQGKYSWRAAVTVVPGDRIVSPLRVWGEETSYEAGWLAGIYDGEGSVNSKTSVSFAQKPGVILDRAKAILVDMGIPFTERKRPEDGCVAIGISVRRYALEVLGRLRPVRLLPKADPMWENRQIYNRGADISARVVEVRDAGQREVVTLETSTGTYLAEGLASHNCEERNFHPGCGQVPCADPEHCGTRWFAAYCLRRIRGAMLDAMRSADHVTRSMRSRAKAIAEADAGHGISEAELAERTGLTIRQVRDTLAQVAVRPVSFDAESHDVADSGDTESAAVVSSVLAAAAAAMDALDAETQVVLALRFHQGLEFAQIAERLGTTEAHVAERHNAGVLKVHEVMLKAVTLAVSPA